MLNKIDYLIEKDSPVAQSSIAIIENKIKNPVEKLLKDFKIGEVIPITKESLLSKRKAKIQNKTIFKTHKLNEKLAGNCSLEEEQ